MPAALCFARIIDSIDHEKGGPQEKYNVWPDVLAGLMNMYNRENFAKETSDYFMGLKKNPSKFIEKCDQKVLDWLKELKKRKTTFILTGSHIDFASHTASFALGEDWRDYFDVVVCYAKKPGFFTMNRPFLTLCGNEERDEIKAAEMKAGEAYTQGSYPELKKLLNLLCKKEEAKVVYVGDNLIQVGIDLTAFGWILRTLHANEVFIFYLYLFTGCLHAEQAHENRYGCNRRRNVG